MKKIGKKEKKETKKVNNGSGLFLSEFLCFGLILGHYVLKLRRSLYLKCWDVLSLSLSVWLLTLPPQIISLLTLCPLASLQPLSSPHDFLV